MLSNVGNFEERDGMAVRSRQLLENGLHKVA
jgi:hypothetical protein